MTLRFVLDSGVAIAWFFKENEQDRLYAASVLRLIEEGAQAHVPAQFHVEVAEFLMRRRRTRSSGFKQEHLATVLNALDGLELRTVIDGDATFRTFVDVAVAYHVQAKDAPFIRLAAESGMPLAVIDGGQRTAARNFGIDLVAFN